jgi:hypothetical protein
VHRPPAEALQNHQFQGAGKKSKRRFKAVLISGVV